MLKIQRTIELGKNENKISMCADHSKNGPKKQMYNTKYLYQIRRKISN